MTKSSSGFCSVYSYCYKLSLIVINKREMCVYVFLVCFLPGYHSTANPSSPLDFKPPSVPVVFSPVLQSDNAVFKDHDGVTTWADKYVNVRLLLYSIRLFEIKVQLQELISRSQHQSNIKQHLSKGMMDFKDCHSKSTRRTRLEHLEILTGQTPKKELQSNECLILKIMSNIVFLLLLQLHIYTINVLEVIIFSGKIKTIFPRNIFVFKRSRS